MARLSDDTAQYIILMGFIVSFSLFFLALVINQSTVVGQSTAEAVIEFPKNDIRDISDAITSNISLTPLQEEVVRKDLAVIALNRKNAVVNYSIMPIEGYQLVRMHYNDGVTVYETNWTSR
jgi:hypothetical protein